MSREGFIIYKSFYAPIENLSDEDKGKLFDALFKFQLFGQEPEKTNSIIPYFLFFKNQFRLDDEKYQKTIERNRGNGSKGGRPKTQVNPENPVGYLEPKKADKDKEKDKDKKKDNILFERFWELYAKKEGREKSSKIFNSLPEDIQQKIIEVVPAYVKKTPDTKYRKNPQTWLNGKHWEDEIQTEQPRPKIFV
jgi:hypothetical protein